MYERILLAFSFSSWTCCLRYSMSWSASAARCSSLNKGLWLILINERTKNLKQKQNNKHTVKNTNAIWWLLVNTEGSQHPEIAVIQILYMLALQEVINKRFLYCSFLLWALKGLYKTWLIHPFTPIHTSKIFCAFSTQVFSLGFRLHGCTAE